ncbi:unnamed protein product [Eruca vesicaria subsp. sativa]|uniref:PROP1-like PPR domain-containing protein n=1 Tax=Eruca vesicaria subsp. sativa TaxID=29727 RepID=A0ABC8L8X4_ERUVS|nr:unnamed protein product [Eruca vesicaria subsp. sativa]
MLVKLRLRVSSSIPRRICQRRFLLTNNTLSNPDESPILTAESPELPSWIKDFLSNKPSSSSSPPISDDEDFVIPSLAGWVQTQKLSQASPVNLAKKPTEDIDKVSDFLNKKDASYTDIVNELSSCDVVVSESLVLQVLRRFSNNWNQAYAFFIWAAKSQPGFNYNHSPLSYNAMVDVLGKCRSFDTMWRVLDEMSSELVTLDTMSKVMRRLAKAGKYNEAVDVFLEMERRYNVRTDTNAMNCLMDALVKENSIEHAHEVFLKLSDTIKPDSRTYNILIHGFCKARRFDDAMGLMKVAEFVPDVVTYTSFVEGYCKEGDFRRVDEILEEMRERGCKPNVVTYTIVMHALGKARQVGEALGVYEKMKEDGCVPDAKFYSSLIHILSKTGRFKDAAEVFEDMTKQGVSRDVLVYNTMISSAVHHSRDEMALRLLKRMEEEEEEGFCSPNVETYAPLLKMCCQKKKMKLLGALLQHMVRNDVSIDVATYILLIRGLCMSGKVEEACLFFEEAMRKGMVPRESTCKMLVEELEKKGMEEAKLKIQSLVQSLV